MTQVDENSQFSKLVTYTTFLRNRTANLFKTGNPDIQVMKDLVSGYNEAASEMSLELQRQNLNEICVIFERVAFGTSFICSKLITLSEKPEPLLVPDHQKVSKSLLTYVQNKSVPHLSFPQIVVSPQGQFGGVNVSTTTSSRFYSSRQSESTDNVSGSLTDRTDKRRRLRQLKMMVDKQTSTFIDHQEDVREMIRLEKMRQSQIDDILENTIINIQYLDEALQHRDDHLSFRNSSVRNELTRMQEKIDDQKQDVEGVLKSHRQDDFKNNVSEVELLQESMKGHIYDVQKTTADRIIQLFNTKIHKYQQMLRTRQTESTMSPISPTKPKKKGTKRMSVAEDCRCALYVKEIVDIRQKLENVETINRTKSTQISDQVQEISSLKLEIEFIKFKSDQAEDAQKELQKKLDEVTKVQRLRYFREVKEAEKKKRERQEKIEKNNKDASSGNELSQPNDGSMMYRNFGENNSDEIVDRSQIQEMTEQVVFTAATFDRDLAANSLNMLAEIFRIKSKQEQFLAVKDLLFDLQGAALNRSNRANSILDDVSPRTFMKGAQGLENSFAFDGNKSMVRPQITMSQRNSFHELHENEVYQTRDNLLSVPLSRYNLNQSQTSDVRKSYSEAPKDNQMASSPRMIIHPKESIKVPTSSQNSKSKLDLSSKQSNFKNIGGQIQQLDSQQVSSQPSISSETYIGYQGRVSESELSPNQHDRVQATSPHMVRTTQHLENSRHPIEQTQRLPNTIQLRQPLNRDDHTSQQSTLQKHPNKLPHHEDPFQQQNMNAEGITPILSQTVTPQQTPKQSYHSNYNPQMIVPQRSTSHASAELESLAPSTNINIARQPDKRQYNMIHLKVGATHSIQTQTDLVLLKQLIADLMDDDSHVESVLAMLDQKLTTLLRDSDILPHGSVDSTNVSKHLLSNTTLNSSQPILSGNNSLLNPKSEVKGIANTNGSKNIINQINGNGSSNGNRNGNRNGAIIKGSVDNIQKANSPVTGNAANGNIASRSNNRLSNEKVLHNGQGGTTLPQGSTQISEQKLFENKHLGMSDLIEQQLLMQDGVPTVEECEPDRLVELMYQQMMSNMSTNAELIEAIKLINPNGKPLTLQEFADFLRRFKQHHLPCGKDCIHLARFYLRLGFLLMKYYSKRKNIKLPKPALKPFNQ